MGVDERTVLSTLAWQRVDDVLLLCVSAADASDDDVTQWLQRLAQHDYTYLLIVARGGGALNSKQRARIGAFWKNSGRSVPPGALLTDSQVARFVVTAITWLVGGDIRAFELDDWSGARAYLGAAAALGELRRTAAALHSSLSLQRASA